MTNRARLSDTEFNPEGGVDLDAIAERVGQRESDIEAAGLNFEDTEQPRRGVGRSSLVRPYR
jgi:hypothetical protein